MRITGFEVDGFGILHDTGTDGLGEGLVVVSGPNGAGKSSLHAYLVRSLFGIPRSNAVGVSRHFDPLRGGRTGGELRLADRDGSAWTIRRVKGGNPTLTVERPDGSTSTSADALRPLVGTLDRERFESLFAIDLDQLVGTEDLPGDQLPQMLFDAAVLGVAGSLRGARTLAEERSAALYIPRGRVQPIAEAKAELRELEQRLDEAQTRVADLSGLRESIGAAEQERAEVVEQLDRVDRERSLHERVREAAAPAAAAREAADTAADPSLAGPEVTDDQRSRLADARERAATAASDAQRLRGELEEQDDELEQLAVDGDVHAVAAEVDGVHGQLVLEEQRRRQLAEERRRADDLRTAADAAVERIGPGWTAERVLAVRVDGEAVDLLDDAAGWARGAAVAVTEAEQALEERRRDAERDQDRLDEDEQRLPEAMSQERLDEFRAAVSALTTSLPVMQQAQAAAASQRAAADQIASLQRGSGAGATSGPPPTVGIAVAVLGLIGLVAGMVLGVPAVAAGSGIVLAIGAWLYGRANGGAGRGGPVMTNLPSMPPPSDADVASAERAVAGAVATLGLPGPPDAMRLGELQNEVATLTRQADDRRAAQERLTAARTELSRLRSRIAEDEVWLSRLHGARDEANAKLTAALETVGLAGVVPDPSLVTKLHERVADAARELTEAGAADDVAGRLATASDAFRKRAVALLARVDREVGDSDVLPAVRALKVDVDADRSARERRDALTPKRDRTSQRLRDAEAAEATAESQVEGLVTELGVADVTALDDAVDRHDRRQQLRSQEADARREVDRILGHGHDAGRGRELLSAGDVAAWDADTQRLAAERDELVERRDELLQQRALAQRELEELGGDDTIPRLALEVEMKREELTELTRRWAVLSVAHGLLGAAVEHFESEQQPVVLEAASALFERFTLGSWAEVRQVDRVLYAIRGDDRDLVPADQLSTGEQAQLYLALRVALADNTDPHLPLLLDDLLGAADDDRADAIVRTLGDLARTRQVFLFTASERTATAATTAIPHAHRLRLEDGRVVG